MFDNLFLMEHRVQEDINKSKLAVNDVSPTIYNYL